MVATKGPMLVEAQDRSTAVISRAIGSGDGCTRHGAEAGPAFGTILIRPRANYVGPLSVVRDFGTTGALS
jgi:hypothetical protein